MQFFQLSVLHELTQGLGLLMRSKLQKKQVVRDILFSLVNVLVWSSGCTEPPDQTKNDTDLKFGTHTLP